MKSHTLGCHCRLGKQDDEYDNMLAEWAECSHIEKSPLDTVWAWLVSLYDTERAQ